MSRRQAFRRRRLETSTLLQLAALFFLYQSTTPFVGGDPSPEEWEECKRCTRKEYVFCYTTMKCMPSLHIDTPTPRIFAKCPNPLMIPESCRSKGIHPPTAEQKKQYAREHAYEEELRAARGAGDHVDGEL